MLLCECHNHFCPSATTCSASVDREFFATSIQVSELRELLQRIGQEKKKKKLFGLCEVVSGATLDLQES